MLGKNFIAVVLAILLGIAYGTGVAYAASMTTAGDSIDVKYDPNGKTVIINNANGVTTYMYSSDGNSEEIWEDTDIIIKSNKELYVGNGNDGGTYGRFDVTVNSVSMESNSTLTLVESSAGGSHLHINTFDAAGTVTIDKSLTVSDRNILSADTFTSDSSSWLSVTVDENSLFEVYNSSNLNNTTIAIMAGAEFISGTEGYNGSDSLTKSTVTVNAYGEAVFNNKLSLDKDSHILVKENSDTTFASSLYIGEKSSVGVANGSTTATILTGTDTKAGDITVANGGTLGSKNKDLVIETYAGIQNTLTFNGSGPANSVLGDVMAEDTQVRVANSLLVDGTLQAYSYNQTSGTVSGDGDSRIYALSDISPALISGSSSVFKISGTFMGGLNVTKGATLFANDNTIDAGGNSQAIMNIGSTSRIDLSQNSMAINDFNTVNLDGDLVLGVTNGEINRLKLGSGVNLSTNLSNSVIFGNSFLQYYQNHGDFTGMDQVIEGGTVNDGAESAWTSSSIFGDFTFDTNKNGMDGTYLTEYQYSDINDLANVRGRLGNQYGSQYINGGIASGVSGVANNMMDESAGLQSDGSYAGDMNYGVFESLAKGLDAWSFTRDGKTYQGILGKGILSTMNGSTAFAPVYVAQDSVRNIQNTVTSRLEAYRAVQECIINEVFASGTALGMADILNDRYLNRIWAGAIGNWQNASERKGYDGWKYNGAGAILGYDRAFGGAIVGTSFAFLDGKYHDKTFSWNDSKIRQYNANLYGTYNAGNGFYATVMGGYNHSRNKLRYGFDGGRADEKYSTNTWYAGGKLGYDIMPCDNFSITPSLGVNYFYSRSGAHDIRVNDAALTHLGRMKNHQLEMPVELKVAYEVPIGDKGGLTFMANGGYTYNFNNKGVRGDVYTGLGLEGLDGTYLTPSKAVGRRLGHHAWNAGGGIKFRYDRWDIGVKYDYYGRNDYNSHRVTGTIGYNF